MKKRNAVSTGGKEPKNGGRGLRGFVREEDRPSFGDKVRRKREKFPA